MDGNQMQITNKSQLPELIDQQVTLTNEKGIVWTGSVVSVTIVSDRGLVYGSGSIVVLLNNGSLHHFEYHEENVFWNPIHSTAELHIVTPTIAVFRGSQDDGKSFIKGK